MSRKKTVAQTQAGAGGPVLEMAPEESEYVQGQEAAREAAWEAAKEGTWNGQALKAWSRERDSLFVRLTERDESGYALEHVHAVQEKLKEQTGPVKFSLEQMVEPLLYIEQAVLVLFLAAHEPEQWDHLRGRPAAFLRASNAWGETQVPKGQEWAAIAMAVQLRTGHRILVPVAVPSGRSGGRAGE